MADVPELDLIRDIHFSTVEVEILLTANEIRGHYSLDHVSS